LGARSGPFGLAVKEDSMRHYRSASPRRPLALGLAAIVIPPVADAQHGLEEVVVTATLRDQSVNEIAQSITVLSGEALDRARGTNLGETLEGQLGVSASFFGAGASRPIIRGLA